MKLGPAGKRVGAWVRAARQEKDWTQGRVASELAKALPIERRTWAVQSNLSKLENGELEHVDIDTVLGLAGVFAVPVATVIGSSRTPVTPPRPPDPLIPALVEVVGSAHAAELDLLDGMVNMIRRRLGLPAIRRPPTRRTAGGP